jgi:transposase-like protein
MPKKVYTDEFRERMIELVGSGRQVESLVREFKVSGQTIRTWVKQHQLDSGSRKDGVTSDERAELARLRRENNTLREERDILKKAAAWFARESTSKSTKDSSS